MTTYLIAAAVVLLYAGLFLPTGTRGRNLGEAARLEEPTPHTTSPPRAVRVAVSPTTLRTLPLNGRLLSARRSSLSPSDPGSPRA